MSSHRRTAGPVLFLACWAAAGAAFSAIPANRHLVERRPFCELLQHGRRSGPGGDRAKSHIEAPCPSRAAPGANPTRRTLLQWLSFAATCATSAAAPVPAGAASYPLDNTVEEWLSELSDQQHFVLRDGGTEAPNSSPLVLERRPGEYQCAGCGVGLFESSAKFEARTGWPSFAQAQQVTCSS
jgi:hypothetical protein